MFVLEKVKQYKEENTSQKQFLLTFHCAPHRRPMPSPAPAAYLSVTGVLTRPFLVSCSCQAQGLLATALCCWFSHWAHPWLWISLCSSLGSIPGFLLCLLPCVSSETPRLSPSLSTHIYSTAHGLPTPPLVQLVLQS